MLGAGWSGDGGRSRARGLCEGGRGRITEQGEPVADPLSGQTLVGTGALVPSPPPRAQIEVRAEQVEKALGDALVDVEIGAQCGIEPLCCFADCLITDFPDYFA